MSGHEYTVEFRIFSSSLDPADITQHLGLQPCQTRTEGGTRFASRIDHGMWAYNGDGNTVWESLADGLACLLDKLEPHQESIAKYRESSKTVWWCANFQSSFDGGPILPADLLLRLGKFGAELFVDNYFSDQKELSPVEEAAAGD